MKIYSRNNKGFTLIELLVVVAIIGLLASVVLASLNSARARAKDAAIKTDMNQLATLMALEFNERGTYIGLQPVSNHWYVDAAACNVNVAGSGFTDSINYKDKAREICVHILATTGPGANVFHVGNSPGGTPDINNKFSIMAWLPSKNRYYCIGSSGANSDTDTGTYLSRGCYFNP